MNLFDLFVKIGVKDEASDHISQIKATTVAAGQLMANAAMAAGSALVNLGKQALDGYANYEQLAGGVETLFKESAGTIQDYADRAYKTAGLSANEYMETVTSFSASLIQSLGGDTAAAAEYANRAIVSMSDNANKMGTDMAMIQNAYQGFAKQNYTMLDNLKLGYGGTQTEMQRLIADAAEMTEIQERLGITVDSSSMSFDNIVNAIQVMQESLGIAGATAAEAEGTISGSTAAMKAAWQNLVVGIGNNNADIDSLLNQFVESVRTVGVNVIPVVKTILTNIGQAFIDNAPEMLANGTIMLGKFALGIVEAIPDVVSKIPEIVTAIVEEFKENGPAIIQIGKDVVLGIWNGIQSLVGWLNEKIGNFVGGIVDNVKGVLGIHSPSRVFSGIGENMAMGLGAGWENEYGPIKNNITSGLDFGTARVGLASSGVGQISNGITSGIINSSSAERNIVINITTTLDGEVLSRKMYDYNEREQLRRGNAFA